MMSDDELGDALRRSLHELVADVDPGSALEEKVFGLASRSSREVPFSRRPRVLIATLAAAVVAIAVGLIGFGRPTVTPSFAVTLEADKSVQVTLYEISGASGANARLKALGVRAVIVPIRSTCTTQMALTYVGISEKPAPTIHILASKIPVGTTIVLAAKRIGANHVEMTFGRAFGKPPSCVKPGSGAGQVRPQ